jgi:hypothetical protein
MDARSCVTILDFSEYLVSADDVITNDFHPRTSARLSLEITAEDFPANIGPMIIVREGMGVKDLFV